jgi:hypothetical protein
MQGPSHGQLQQSAAVEAATQLRSRAGNVDLGSSEPPSPSPLRRSSTPVDDDEPDEEVDCIAQSTWGVSDRADEEVAEHQTPPPVAASRPIGKALLPEPS